MPSALRRLFPRDTPGLAKHGGGRRAPRCERFAVSDLMPRVRSDLTRSVFSTILRIYRIGNLHVSQSAADLDIQIR